MAKTEEHWAARARMRQIESWLWWRGYVGRREVMETFSISSAQASSDLQRYLKLNPHAMAYHTSRKRYESGPKMECVLHTPCLLEGLSITTGANLTSAHKPTANQSEKQPGGEQLGLPPVTLQPIPPLVQRFTLVAIAQNRLLEAKVILDPKAPATHCKLTIGGLGFNGQSWHLRAFPRASNTWQDIPLCLIQKPKWPNSPADDTPTDTDWHDIIELSLRPKGKPSTAELTLLQHKYQLDGNRITLRIRRAMKPYVLQQFGLGNQTHWQEAT